MKELPELETKIKNKEKEIEELNKIISKKKIMLYNIDYIELEKMNVKKALEKLEKNKKK